MYHPRRVVGFEVLKKLAEGCAAEAFLVRQQEASQRAVIEILKPEMARELRQHFLQEASALKARPHPHLLRRAHVGETGDGRPFAVSEPVQGETLTTTIWSMGLLEPQDVIQLAIPLCAALQNIHQSGTAHGALCSENVYLPGGLGAYRPQLVDLRLALLWGSAANRNASAKLECLAPECLAGQAVDGRADIYAMGILLYEALTGFPPFTAASAEEMLRKQRRGMPSLPASCEDMAPIVQRCLQLTPADRYLSAEELSAALARELEIITPPTGVKTGTPKYGVTSFPGRINREAPVHLTAPAAGAEPRLAAPGRRPPKRKRLGSYAAVALAAVAIVGAGSLSRKHPIASRRALIDSRGAAAPSPLALKAAPTEAGKTQDAPAPDSKEPVRLEVTSEPPGALVVWARSGEPLGRTPLVASVPRQPDESTVRIELPGYRPASRRVRLDGDASAHAKLRSAAAPIHKKAARRRHRTG